MLEESYRLVVVDLDVCDGDVQAVQRAAENASVLLVGDAAPRLREVVDDHLANGADVAELFHRAMNLVELSRPVRLPRPLRWGPLELDVGRRIASWDGRQLGFTTLQFRIMEVLVLAAGLGRYSGATQPQGVGRGAFEDRRPRPSLD